MGTYQKLVNLEEQFYNHIGKQPTVINDVPAFTEEDKAKLNKLIFTTYSGDLLSNIPSCECGEITTKHNLGAFCPNCETYVTNYFDKDLMPLTWIRSPKGVAKMMNPTMWTMLKKKFTVSSYNLIHWLCDTTYNPGTKPPPVLYQVSNMLIRGKPIERGYNFFVENFDEIMAQLFAMSSFRQSKNRKTDLEILINEQRDCIFSQYLPIPHRSLLVVEESDVSVFIDPITTQAIDAIRTLAGIDTGFQIHNLRVLENRTAKTIDQLSAVYESIDKDTLARKRGLYRKHVYATRCHFSFRGVITSITKPHNYDEIYIPWGIAISALRLHLVNKLLKMDYTPNEAIKFLDEHVEKYHPLIDALFKELIAESANGRGIPCLLNRNPSLQRGSIQLVYISQVTPDPKMTTIWISILIVKSLNADFDGKALPSVNFSNCWKSLRVDSPLRDESQSHGIKTNQIG